MEDMKRLWFRLFLWGAPVTAVLIAAGLLVVPQDGLNLAVWLLLALPLQILMDGFVAMFFVTLLCLLLGLNGPTWID